MYPFNPQASTASTGFTGKILQLCQNLAEPSEEPCPCQFPPHPKVLGGRGCIFQVALRPEQRLILRMLYHRNVLNIMSNPKTNSKSFSSSTNSHDANVDRIRLNEYRTSNEVVLLLLLHAIICTKQGTKPVDCCTAHPFVQEA